MNVNRPTLNIIRVVADHYKMTELYDRVFVVIPWLAITYALAGGVHKVTQRITVNFSNTQ